MNELDLMSDDLTNEKYERQKLETQREAEIEFAMEQEFIIRLMLLRARNKPKQSILMFRIQNFIKQLGKEFPPETNLARIKEEMAAELGEGV
jgi:hypothetical protein